MIQARHAVAISCGALLVAALAATSRYIGSQEKTTQQATIQSGVVLLPGETLVAPPDPVVTSAAPAPPKQGKQPSTPHYTRDEVLRGR
jgi:hypothetical protein